MKILLAALVAGLLLIGCTQQGPAATPTPQATATPAPTATPEATVAATATPTPAPEYPALEMAEFVQACEGKAQLNGFLKNDFVKEGELNSDLVKYWIAYDSKGLFVPLAGWPPVEKPATIDASSSVSYKYYGTAKKMPNSEFKCYLQIEKMA